MKSKSLKVVYDGRFIRMMSNNGWEYASRKNLSGIVGIIAITDDRQILLIEQFRPPIGKKVIEIPAGLAGDVKGSENEPLVNAAKRELLEETGYTARKWKEVASGVPSAGICDESITLFLATGLKKTSESHGDGSEQITSHLVPLDKVDAWIRKKQRAGYDVDLKVYSALYWATKPR